MTIKRNPLDPWGVIFDAIKEVGGAAEAGKITGRPKQYMEKVSIRPNPDSDETPRYLSYVDLRELVAAGATAPLYDLARLAGADLLPVKAATASGCIHTGLASIAKETGEAIASIAKALIDGKITPNEAADMCRELLELQAAVTAMLQQLQTYMRGG